MVGLERLLIGRTLDGRYAIEELIGQGRGGLVYRARDGEAGCEVALKVLAAPRSPEARVRYRQLVAGEVRLAAALQHGNLAVPQRVGTDAELDLDYVVMELVRGQTLASVLSQRGKPPISLGLRLLTDAAAGLAAGHQAGLVHRDLRPASLYLVRSEVERQVRVKVAGFGIPQLVRRESLAVAGAEITAYAAPELLANGSVRATPACDVYSLGAVGFELLTGRQPLDDAGRRAMAEGRVTEIEPPAELSAGVPPHVMEAVLQALRMNPGERYADGAAFGDALRQVGSARVAVPKIVPARAPAAEEPAQAEAVAEPEAAPAEAAAAEPAPAEVLPVVAVESAAAVLAEAELPHDAAADSAAGDEWEDAPSEAASAEAGVAAAAERDETAGGAGSEDAAPETGAVAEAEPVAEAVAGSSAAATPAAYAPPPPPPASIGARKPGGAKGDLDLYYPPQGSSAPAPEREPIAARAAASSGAAAIEGLLAPGAELEPAASVVAPPAPGIPITTAAAVAEVAAPAPVSPVRAVERTPAAPAALPARPARKLRLGASRPPAGLAAGFVLGLLVLGSVAWMATRKGTRAEATPSALAATNQLAAATPGPGAVAPAAAVAAADSNDPEAQRRARELEKQRQQELARRQAQADSLRRAQQLQQQPAAAQQVAQVPVPPAAAAQPVRPQPAAPQPVQQVAAAPPPAAPPAAPPAREEASAPAASNEVYDIGEVEQRPQLTNQAEIQRTLQTRYPSQLYSSRISGRVTATFVVNADGRVDPSTIRILNTPNEGFNLPTSSVLRRARFRPATVRGTPVRVQVTMPVQWNLDQ